MNRIIGKLTTWLAAAFVVVGCASIASAQVFTGRIEVTVEDSTGGRLPGVTVDLTGPIAQTQVTDTQGQARFLNLPVGTYAVKASLAGFNTFANNTVQVVSGSATPISAKLGVAGTTETVNVTAATPVIDLKRDTTTTNVTLEELQNIPSSRDPWAVMQTVPTVYMDRVNVGGAESGQQSNYNAKGANERDNTWAIDGVPITDMGATGSSAFYYDFDSFQEMAITTGGADAQNATGGVQLNMILRKGSNKASGNARIYFENDSLQAVNISPELAAALGNTTGKGNRTDKYEDYGFDLGGPLLKDRLWAWGTIARTDINLLTLTNDADNTIFKNYAFKADGVVNQSVRGNFTFYENNKIKNGRSAGPLRPAGTAWDQTGPTKYFKGEGNFVLGSRLFATAKYAHVDGGFVLAPQGGLGTDYYFDDGGVAHNTFYQYQSNRPQDYVSGDGSYFAGKHEVKFGGAWRSTPVTTQQIWPASHLIASWDTYPNMFVQIARDYEAATEAKYMNGFVTDTISLDRLTVIGGIRFDHQESSLGSASVPGVPGIPILPALSAPAVSGVYKWNNVTPRIGITYAVDEARKTVVRASYAMFASQLPGDSAKFVSPIQYSYAYYNAVDRNGDGIAQVNELLFNQGLQGYTGFDPTNPSRLSTVNTVDPNVKAPITHEFLVGMDKELLPNFSVSGTFTYRRMVDLIWDPLSGVKSSDYTQTGTLTRQHSRARRVQCAALRAAVGGGAGWRRRDRDQPPGVPPEVPRLRVQRDQAHVQSLDGALWLLDQRLARILRRSLGVDHRSDEGAGAGDHAGTSVRGAADRRWAGRAQGGRQRQEQHLPGRPAVSVRGQRIVRGAVGPQLRRQSRDPAGLRGTVLPVQRRDRRSARAEDRAAREPGGCLPPSVGHLSRRPRREAVHVRQVDTSRARLRCLQRPECRDRAGQAVRRAADGRDRIRSDAGDHEPAHRKTGGEVYFLRKTVLSRLIALPPTSAA